MHKKNPQTAEYDHRKQNEVAYSTDPLITWCRYGSLVLNSEKLIILDIDGRGVGDISRAQWSADVAGVSILVYRTHSGHRWIIDSDTQPARAFDFEAYPVDPVYALLCRVYGTYRARLTPKLWRVPGLMGQDYSRRPPLAINILEAHEYCRREGGSLVPQEQVAEFAKSHTAAHFIGRVGDESALPELLPIIAEHDLWCDNNKPLA